MSRPRLGQLQREVDVLRRKMEKVDTLERQVKENKEEIKNIKRREAIQMLQERNTPKSSRYRYSYEEIGEYIGTSTATISNIAKEEGLSRRNNNFSSTMKVIE